MRREPRENFDEMMESIDKLVKLGMNQLIGDTSEIADMSDEEIFAMRDLMSAYEKFKDCMRVAAERFQRIEDIDTKLDRVIELLERMDK